MSVPTFVFRVLLPYERSAAFMPLQHWAVSERLRIHEPRESADVEAASRPRSFRASRFYFEFRDEQTRGRTVVCTLDITHISGTRSYCIAER